jgi:hypothetical protein
MNTTKGWGWLTAGVLALGLNGIYQDGGAVWAHRIASRMVYGSVGGMNLTSDGTNEFLERARMVAARNRALSCPLAAAMARVQEGIARGQSGFARLDAMSAAGDARMAWLEANRAQIEAQMASVQLDEASFNPIVVKSVLAKWESVPVGCPRIRVNVPRVNVHVAPIMPVSLHVSSDKGPI